MQPFALFMLVFALLAAGCAATVPLASQQPDRALLSQPVPPDVAHLYVVRPGSVNGHALLFGITLDGVQAGFLANDTYFQFTVQPGRHTVFASSAENIERLDLTMAGGQTYYVRTQQRMGMLQNRVGLRLIEAEEAFRLLTRSHQAARLDQ